MSLNPWTCDCDLQRVFGKIQYVRHLHVEDYKAILCHAPPQQAGSPLASMDSQLCMAETASVLVITITVMLAVIGALVKAERNRKNKQAASDAESSDKWLVKGWSSDTHRRRTAGRYMKQPLEKDQVGVFFSFS